MTWRRPDAPLGYGHQSIDSSDRAAVEGVLHSSHLTQGPAVAAFESSLCRATGARAAVATCNGTAALHLAMLVSGVGPGGLVWTSANTFLASATSAAMCGARIEFVDIELASGNVDLRRLAGMLAAGPVPDVLVVTHFAGRSCDMEALVALKQRYGFKLIVDAAHALGARPTWGGQQWGLAEHKQIDAVCLSFHPVKSITTGEGGAYLTGDRELGERARRLASHGVERRPREDPFPGLGGTGGSPPHWYAPMVQLGYNYRMSDLQAALGNSQLARLDSFVEQRRSLAERYDAGLKPFDEVKRPALEPEHAWHLYHVRVPAAARDELMAWLADGGIHTQLHYYPLPLMPWFRARDPERGEEQFPMAVEHARTAISLPLYPDLSESDQARVLDAFAEWFGR